MLVRDSPTEITTAAIVPEGNKILYSEEMSSGWSQIYSVGVNPKNGAVVNGPTQRTTDSTDYYYYYYVRSIAKNGRKFSYDRYDGSSTGFDVWILFREGW